MKLFALFAITALLGTVSCFEDYSECFLRKFFKCEIVPVRTCSDMKAQANCTLTAAQECDMGFIKDAYEVLQVVNRACFDEVNENLMKDKQCYRRAIADGHCIKRINDFLGSGDLPEDILEGHKRACMQMAWFKRCVKKHVEETCSEDSEDDFSTFLDPLVALHKRICREVIFSLGEDYPNVNGLPNVFDDIINIFKEN